MNEYISCNSTIDTNIGIAICTAKRPKMLLDCIKSISLLNAPDDVSLSVIIVENDTTRSVDLEQLNALCPYPIEYTCETQRGIPFARNRTLEIAREKNLDFLALIDDDETADPDWLRAHLETIREFSADATFGPVSFEYPDTTPEWYPKEEPAKMENGAQSSWAATNNNLLSSRVFSEDGYAMQFDTDFTGGGEDIDFFQRLHRKGGKTVWCADGRVTEVVAEARVTLPIYLNRARIVARNLVMLSLKRKGLAKTYWRFMLRMFKCLLKSGIIHIDLLMPFSRSRKISSAKKVNALRLISEAKGYAQGIYFRSPVRIRPIEGK
ncbi:glycosyltransferase [Roseibium sp. RKSG952]|uniref:glycosyltransferase family 2 protein n=1 Tax=Roseibium sp. RKSG952 TaxID=2529384 RepID=UPI0012BCD15E|nr:glycosyltransferase family 2 protein [Roseibium sp. RKSG952]